MKGRNARSAGFTLVEILVVIVIASIVFAVLASVLGSSFEILRTGETRSQLSANAQAALEYLCDDIQSASQIPLSFDRDLNGYPDEHPELGYDEEANYRVAWFDNNVPVVAASFLLSEAWSDRIQTMHDSTVMVMGQQVENRSFSLPRVLRSGGETTVAEYRSFFRLAVPANQEMPYYLSSEWDRDDPPDGIISPPELRNTGFSAGQIEGYPELVPVGPHKETCALIQDIFYQRGNEEIVRRIRQMPIASNITRVKYEYLHEVPVYLSRVSGGNIEVAYQNINPISSNAGEIVWVDDSATYDTQADECVPLISHWDLRIVDVGYNNYTTDPGTGAQYGGMNWRLRDQYPEGMSPDKLNGSHVTPASLGLENWNCSVFYNISSRGGNVADNAPIDRLAYVTTGTSGGQVLEGGMAGIRPDMEYLHGTTYYTYTQSPTDIGDMGDADGIPDGDGVPDDPIPGWWLPYLRAVRVTVVATPRQIIDERRAKSGKPGKGGTLVYYRLDSPVPYQDADRITPLYNQKQDYVGVGRDIVITKTVPVDYVYRQELVVDPRSTEFGSSRRVEYNYFEGLRLVFPDPLEPGTQIKARTPSEKLWEKDPP